ncbi:MAG: hypothetical protein WBG86_03485 [Polyangiales bacterium]
MIDRRIRRSQDPYRALCLQLEQSRTRGALDAVVLATDNGLLIAGAGEPSLCEALCAAAPLFETRSLMRSLPEVLEGHRLDVRAVPLHDDLVYVATAGDIRADRWLQHSVNGVRRILDEGTRPPRRPTPPPSELSVRRQLAPYRRELGISDELSRTAFK